MRTRDRLWRWAPPVTWIRVACFVLAIGIIGGAVNGAAAEGEVTEILPPTPIASGGYGDFMTPIAVYKGAVYTVNTEPPQGGTPGMNLRTVVRKGVPAANGTWRWEQTVIEDRTLDDPWHTQASIAVDKNGYIHVVYNMHNMPWQYTVSNRPGDISAFTFRGFPLSTEQLNIIQFHNQTPFPSFGTAAIPGTMVTYPAFFKDRNGELYVTYRFAAKPKRPHVDRVYSCGMARYDTATSRWAAIGGKVGVDDTDGDSPAGAPVRSVTAFCATSGLWGNGTVLFFDRHNLMHVVWDWEDYRLGAQRTDAFVYAESSDGGATFRKRDGAPYSLPVAAEASEEIVRLLPGQRARASMVEDGRGALGIIAPLPGKGANLYTWDAASGHWTVIESSPVGAWQMAGDGKGSLIAVGTGPVVAKSANGSFQGPWNKLFAEQNGWGIPKLVYAAAENAFYLHLKKCVGFVESRLHEFTDLSQGNCQMRILRIAD